MKYLFAAFLAASAVIVIVSSSDGGGGSSGSGGSSGLPKALRLKAKAKQERKIARDIQLGLIEMQKDEQESYNPSSSGSSSATPNTLKAKEKKVKIHSRKQAQKAKEKKVKIQNDKIQNFKQTCEEIDEFVQKNVNYGKLYEEDLKKASTIEPNGSTSEVFEGYLLLKELNEKLKGNRASLFTSSPIDVTQNKKIQTFAIYFERIRSLTLADLLQRDQEAFLRKKEKELEKQKLVKYLVQIRSLDLSDLSPHDHEAFLREKEKELEKYEEIEKRFEELQISSTDGTIDPNQIKDSDYPLGQFFLDIMAHLGILHQEDEAFDGVRSAQNEIQLDTALWKLFNSPK